MSVCTEGTEPLVPNSEAEAESPTQTGRIKEVEEKNQCIKYGHGI